ncbi:hypothetical protein [Cryobacterium sp. Hh7]|nr:hypothetical protein [Cryobacterium sp. Hh7]
MTDAVDRPDNAGSIALATIAALRELKFELTRFMLKLRSPFGSPTTR